MHFTDLEIYQISNKITIEIYNLTKSFPKSERYGVTDQLRRASSSIGANIAESSGRYHYKDKIKFIYNSRGSLYEVEHFLILSNEMEYITKEDLHRLKRLIKTLSVKLNNYINYLSNKVQ